MAVYTTLSNQQIQDFLSQHYALDLVSVTPISAGTENTNYRISVKSSDSDETQDFVLTLFESMPAIALQQVINLTQSLAQQAIPVPTALDSVDQKAIQTLLNKPAILTNFVAGQPPLQPSAEQCYQVAAALANIHLAGNTSLVDQAYHLLDALNELSEATALSFSSDEQQKIAEEIAYYSEFDKALKDLPQSVLHTDLFKDNTLFDDQQLCAILDFYSAAKGSSLFDLAVLINDWCFAANNDFITENYAAMLNGYQSQRELTSHETALLPLALRMTACRFWLSRTLLAQQHQGALAGKNPEDFKARLLFHLSNI